MSIRQQNAHHTANRERLAHLLDRLEAQAEALSGAFAPRGAAAPDTPEGVRGDTLINEYRLMNDLTEMQLKRLEALVDKFQEVLFGEPEDALSRSVRLPL